MVTRDEDAPKSRLLPLLGRAKERAVARLEEPGVAASDFRAEPITWSPPSTGFSGRLDLRHRLGRMPRGIVQIGGGLPLSFLADAGMVDLWTSESVSIYLDAYHHWASGRDTLASAATDKTFVFPLPRPSGVGLVAALTQEDNQSTDRPPMKVRSFVTSGADIIGVSFGLASGAAPGFSIDVNIIVRTALAKSDELVFLVV